MGGDGAKAIGGPGAGAEVGLLRLLRIITMTVTGSSIGGSHQSVFSQCSSRSPFSHRTFHSIGIDMPVLMGFVRQIMAELCDR